MEVLIWAIECFVLLVIFIGLMTVAFKDVKGHHHYCFAGRTTIWLNGDQTCPVCGRY